MFLIAVFEWTTAPGLSGLEVYLRIVAYSMGTFLLAWYVVRDRACAGFGGLVAMISTPMMIHGQGHLELIQLGAVPLFLIAWLRFVDRPTTGRMLAAWACFGLIAASAAYYAVLSTIPAAWYVAWRALSASARA